jgi:hypothetical protein
MTLQTTHDLIHRSMSASQRQCDWFAMLLRENDEHDDPLRGGLDLNPPYQRGSVWTTDQQRLLMKSFLLGVPVPALIVNDRHQAGFRQPDGSEDWRYAVVDGRQRIEAVIGWLSGRLDIPASWLPADHVVSTVETDDGPYVFRSGLSEAERRRVSTRMLVPVCTAHLTSLADEAAVYLLVNRGGVEHTEADLSSARQLAGDLSGPA